MGSLGAEGSLWLLLGCHTHTTGCSHLLPPSLLPKAGSARIMPTFQHTDTADTGTPAVTSAAQNWVGLFLYSLLPHLHVC